MHAAGGELVRRATCTDDIGYNSNRRPGATQPDAYTYGHSATCTNSLMRSAFTVTFFTGSQPY
jgi:hypothetical protein